MAPIDAVVLAGGPHDDVARLALGAPNKAFVPVAGRSLVARTLAALRATPAVGRIVAVAPAAAHGSVDLREADACVPDGATMLESLRAGLAAFAPDTLTLICASDLALLSPAALEEFLGRAVGARADLVYACVERSSHLAAFPDVPHTWARLREGVFCGGGVVAMRPRVLPALARLLGRLGAARKNPVRLAAIFGPGVLARYAVRRLTIADAERHASVLLGAPAVAAPCLHAEIAVNVDRASDLPIVERILRDLDDRDQP